MLSTTLIGIDLTDLRKRLENGSLMYCSLSSYSMGNLAPSIARGNRRSKESQDRDPSELAVTGRAESDVSGICRIGSKACALCWYSARQLVHVTQLTSTFPL